MNILLIMKNKKQNILLDISNLTEKEIELLQSLVREEDRISLISEKEGVKIIGNILKKSRNVLGLTQPEIAAMAGYENSQFVGNVERGASKVPIGKIKDFVTAYGADELLRPAIIKLCHQDKWPEILSILQIAGADAPAFDYKLKNWILENK
jgi:transcriptional regulator with XRE-family HTH domain